MITMRAPTMSGLAGFTRRLGTQAAMSALVMVGLNLASIGTGDLRQWMFPKDASPSGASRQAEALRVVGVPARFDTPVQAGGAIEQLSQTAGAEAARPMPADPDRARVTTSARTEDAAATGLALADVPALPQRIATPTPRPVLPAAAPRTLPPSILAADEAPDELPFDVSSPRNVQPVELVAVLDEIPAPPEPERHFTLGGIVPSGSAILRGASDITGSAAGLVVGTASRVIDLVR